MPLNVANLQNASGSLESMEAALLSDQSASALLSILTVSDLLKIISKLKLNAISSVGMSCKRFHLLTKDNSLWNFLFRKRFSTSLPKEIALKEGSFLEAYKKEHRVHSNLSNGVFAKSRLLSGDWGVYSFSVADDRLFAGFGDGRILVWDLKTGKQLATLEEHGGWVYSLASSDGKLYSGSSDRTIKVWDLKTLEFINTLEGHEDAVDSLTIADGKLFSGSGDGRIKVWDLKTQENLATFQEHEADVYTLVCTDGKLISGSADGTIKIWDILTGICQATLLGHTEGVRSLAVEGNRLYSGSSDNTIKIWDLVTGECQTTLVGHTNEVRSLIIANGKLISGSGDWTIKIWDPKTMECRVTLKGHGEWIKALAFVEGKLFSGDSGGTGGEIRAWDFNASDQMVFSEIADQLMSSYYNGGFAFYLEELMDRFSAMPLSAKNQIFAELKHILASENQSYSGSGEDAFYDREGEIATDGQKARAIQKYLNSF